MTLLKRSIAEICSVQTNGGASAAMWLIAGFSIKAMELVFLNMRDGVLSPCAF